MRLYKLVVVSPFNDFKKGDFIMDAALIDRILDPKDIMHEYENNVRRVLLSDAEKQMYVAPVAPAVAQPVAPVAQEPQKQNVNEAAPVHIESIKSENDVA